MTGPKRVCIWATTPGADLWSFTSHLDRRDDYELVLVVDDPDTLRGQPIWALRPLRARVLRRGALTTPFALRRFAADVTVLDNHVPKYRTSPRGFVLWHGFGWRGPNDRVEFANLHRSLGRLWGDPLTPNLHFRWQCFGPWDFAHRTEVSGFAPENCRVLGIASADDLAEPWDRSDLQRFYPFDVASRPTVLLAPTWHYGEIFAHWGNDEDVLRALFERVRALDANLIFRLHDRKRYDRAYVARIERIALEHANVCLKFKDTHPDNLVDLQIADVLVTNYSSIANLFYATGRPTLHVYPVRSADEAFSWRTLRHGRVETRTVENARFVWKLDPEEHGGLLVRDVDTLLADLGRALTDPDLCRERARAFCDRYLEGARPGTCDRIRAALEELIAS